MGGKIREMRPLEADALRPLPTDGFDVSLAASHRVDRKSRVSVRGFLYSVATATSVAVSPCG